MADKLSPYSGVERTLKQWSEYLQISGFICVLAFIAGVFLALSAQPLAQPIYVALAVSCLGAMLSTWWLSAIVDVAVEASRNLREANEHLRKLVEKEPV